MPAQTAPSTPQSSTAHSDATHEGAPVLPGRRERKRQQTADHLADTAWALFDAHGYASVTMEAIAEAADVAKGTLYKHFPVKEALLRHRFHRELAAAQPEMHAAFAGLPTAESALRTFLAHSAVWSTPRRDYLGHYVRYRLGEIAGNEHLSHEARSGLDRVFTALIARGQAEGEFNTNRPADEVAHYLQFLYLACLMRWLKQPALDLAAEFNAMLDLVLDGLLGRP